MILENFLKLSKSLNNPYNMKATPTQWFLIDVLAPPNPGSKGPL